MTDVKKLLGTLIASALALSIMAPASAGATKPIWTDDVGDAGLRSQAQPLPGADQAGLDLASGAIVKKGANLEFTVTHAAMPANGGLPEGFRFLWHFGVGNEQYRFTFKSADIGKPDVLAGTGNERVGTVDVDGVYRLETCGEEPLPAVLTLINCSAVAYLEGSIDPATSSFTIVLPLKTIKAKTGTVITPGVGGASGTGCQICWVPHYAERSLTPHTILDEAVMPVSFKVPR